MKDIKIKKIDGNKIPMDLLLSADPSEKAIKKYLKKGTCFAAYKGVDVIGVCVLISRSEDSLEIVNIAVTEDNQNKGIGKLLLSAAIKRSKKEGTKKY